MPLSTSEPNFDSRRGPQRLLLGCLFALILVVLLACTIRASLVRSVLDNGDLMSDVWFQATLLDAYLGFLTFYVWVAWKEQTLLRRLIWFVLIMSLGNIAMSAYVILQLILLPPGSHAQEILTRR